jgi:hypothetical protein
MWSLALPSIAGVMDDLTTAVTEANGKSKYGLTPAERAEVQALYMLYDGRLGRPHPDLAGPLIGNGLKDVIHDAYNLTQKKRRLKHIRSALMVAADRCPYCGITAVSDLDHHLAKAHYRALAIYTRNLVPACHQCNRIKNASPPSLHAYFPEVPLGERFFRAVAAMVGNALTVEFRIEQTPGMTVDVRDRARQQLIDLKLNTRYESEINEYVVSLHAALKSVYEPDGDAGAVSDLLTRTAADYEARFGLNYWKPVLLHALSACVPFCSGGFSAAAGLP